MNYFREVRSEMKMVSWPKREETIKLTLTVLVVSGIVGLYVGGLDLLFTKLLEIVLIK